MKTQQRRKRSRANSTIEKDASPVAWSRPLSTCGILLLGVLLLAFLVSSCAVLAANSTVEGPFVDDSMSFSDDAESPRGVYSRGKGMSAHSHRSGSLGESAHGGVAHVQSLERKREQVESSEDQVDAGIGQMLRKRSRSGTGTFFEPGMGACGHHSSSGDMITAISKSIWDGGAHCGKSAKVCKSSDSSHCVTVQIVDECPSCSAGSLDLSPAAFKGLASLSVGEVHISWSFA